jgi:hypothetical protein
MPATMNAAAAAIASLSVIVVSLGDAMILLRASPANRVRLSRAGRH